MERCQSASAQFTAESSDGRKQLEQLVKTTSSLSPRNCAALLNRRASQPAHIFKVVFTGCTGCFQFSKSMGEKWRCAALPVHGASGVGFWYNSTYSSTLEEDAYGRQRTRGVADAFHGRADFWRTSPSCRQMGQAARDCERLSGGCGPMRLTGTDWMRPVHAQRNSK